MSMSSGRRWRPVACTAAARFWEASSIVWAASRLMRTSTIPYGARWMCAVRVSNMSGVDYFATHDGRSTQNTPNTQNSRFRVLSDDQRGRRGIRRIHILGFFRTINAEDAEDAEFTFSWVLVLKSLVLRVRRVRRCSSVKNLFLRFLR